MVSIARKSPQPPAATFIGPAPTETPAPAAAPLSAIALLTSGGDARIQLDETTGLNRYGCQPYPDDAIAAFGSSTASVISVASHARAEQLTDRLSRTLEQGASPAALYEEELERIRRELTAKLGLADLDGLKTVIGASGTDLHRIVAQMIGAAAALPPLAILSEPAETGSGVGSALGGQSSAGQSLRAHIAALRSPGAALPCQIVTAPCRSPDGAARPTGVVDQEVATLAAAAASMGRRVLLVLIDVSKTGLISPSLDCALDLKRRFPEQVEVFVDACQMRIAPATLRAYLQNDFLVAITGSKFMTGPTFSAALFTPAAAARRLSAARLPIALAPFSARAEWPLDWPGAGALPASANFGLLLRWRAALDEMDRFLALPERQIRGFMQRFETAVTQRLDADPQLRRLSQPSLDRAALNAPPSWDDVQTIHPFALQGRDGPLGAQETLSVYRLMSVDLGGWARAVGADERRQGAAGLRVQLGQPVSCGGTSALRLCASARLAVDALAPGGRGAEAVIDDALACLDKVAWLSRRLTGSASPGD